MAALEITSMKLKCCWYCCTVSERSTFFKNTSASTLLCAFYTVYKESLYFTGTQLATATTEVH